MSLQQRTRGWEKSSKDVSDFEYENLLKLEKRFDIKLWIDKGEREGYLYNVVPTTMNVILKNNNKNVYKSGVHMYFVSDNNKTWRMTIFYRPYFYLKIKNIYNYEEITKYLKKEYEKYNIEIDYIKKDDLSLYDHLNKKRNYLNNIFFKLSFDTLENLIGARDHLMKIVEKNKKYMKEQNINNNQNIINQENINAYDLLYKNDFISSKTDDIDYLKNSNYNEINKKDKYDSIVNEIKLNMNEVITNPKKRILTKDECIMEILEIYEYDVKYITRLFIDKNIRCGLWYKVIRQENELYTDLIFFQILNKKVLAPLNVLAWDIECYKDELKFPDKEKDEIILISYMYNGQGYLIVNRNVMSKNINEFFYRPNIEYSGAGSFKIYNEENEFYLLKRFLEHIRLLKIHIFVTYNGDFFDIPYLYRRCEINNLNVKNEIGFHMNNKLECSCNFILNIDCYKWVERDSYLPNGSRTLKAVCKIKLKYNPTEVDPESMVSIARNNPQHLAVYSVSDAVATFYLYDKYIHNFLFALASIIPMVPDDVLRQGSGTLCEQLLMAEAYKKNILFPNKSKSVYNKYYTDPENKNKYFIYEDSFVGGTVQSLKCGIYRSDLKETFNLDVETYKYLVNNIDNIIDFWIEKDLNKNLKINDEKYIHKNQILNIEDIKLDIFNKLNFFIQNPNINICPLIYHLDVAAMYPNIILSHRLQPNAIITPDHCFNCSYYKQRHLCQKKMIWKRKLEIAPVDYGHILSLKHDLKTRLFYPQKTFKGKNIDQSDSTDDENKITNDNKKKSWNELTEKQQNDELIKAIKEYSQKIYKKTKLSKETDTSSLVCQRENSFYVDTVRTFRDRRYVYKKGLKECEHEKRELLKKSKINYMKIQELDDKILLNDSLQLAHKCILNSFYGYVKRRSSRWYSDQMGAIVTYTGSQIINDAFKLIQKIGIPIELDTDGIWCMLPQHFPEIYDVYIIDKDHIHLKNEYKQKDTNELKEYNFIKKVDFEYPTNILNFEMHKKWTNHQYLIYNEKTNEYDCISKNEIFFELDGPWYGMFLPASEKSDELLKKRYVVFNDKYNISELKGFEIKRRGELRIIQKFQSEIFQHFLKGNSKEESYYYASLTANKWKNLIDTKANDINNDDELFELILARKVLNKSVKEQPNAKSMGITTAKRLSELLNNTSYIEDNNVFTQFIVASHPIGSDITYRAIPIQIFKTNLETQIYYLSKWLDTKFTPNKPINVRDIIDWGYYKQKLETQILKIIIIPAIKQNINNPITSITIPDWLKKQISMSEEKQKKITSFFTTKKKTDNIINNNNNNIINNNNNNIENNNNNNINNNNNNNNNNIVNDINKQDYYTHPFISEHKKRKRSYEECLLDNFINKKTKIIVLNEHSTNITNSNYKKINSLDNLSDANNIIIIDHEKINIANLKMKDLNNYFENNFKNWFLINKKIWKNNRSQIKKIRNENNAKKKRISFTEKSDINNKILNMDSKFLHIIHNPIDIVYLYKKKKIKKTKGKKKNETTQKTQTNTKNKKEILLKPYLKYFKHETESESSEDEDTIFEEKEIFGDNDDDGIYYALVSIKNKNKFYKIKLQVYRHIYINNYEKLDVKGNKDIAIKLVSSSNDNEVFKGKACTSFFLPRNIKIFNLYEFIMKEKYFNQYVVNTLNANYHENIISVYETRIPLYYDFISRYGNSVEIHSNDYNSIFDEKNIFKSHCFSKLDKKKDISEDYLEDIHIIYIHIFHTLVNDICDRIFICIYDQCEENNKDDFFLGNKIMFSGLTNENDFDPYIIFTQFLQLNDKYEEYKNEIIKNMSNNINNDNNNNNNNNNINNNINGTINGTIKNDNLNNLLKEFKSITRLDEEKDELINKVFDKTNFIKNVNKDLLFLYHYRKFDIYHETNTNVYKVLEYLDLYLNKYRNNLITGKKKYVFYVSSTIEKKKLGWWSTNKYFPCFFYKIKNPFKYQNIPKINYKNNILQLSLELFCENYNKVEQDLNFSRISNIPFFNLLNINNKNKKHKFIYDVLYASFIRKYKGILWLSYLGNYDLGIPCLNNNYCDYDIEKKSTDIINPGIYRGYIIHLFFNESLIFNSVRLFTKYSNVKNIRDYDHVYVKNPKKNPENYKGNNKYNKNNTKLENAEEDELDINMDDNPEEINNSNTNASNIKNLMQNKYDINLIVERDAHVSQFSKYAFKLLGQVLEYLISKISTLSLLVTNKSFENISEIFTSFYSWISSNTSLLYDVALYNKVQECSEIYRNNLINIMKTKFNANIIYADLRNFVISFNEYSVIAGRNILKNLINYFANVDSIYANVPFYIKEEYIATCQFDKYNFIRYKEYENPNENNTDENLKIIEYLPPICESFLRYVLDVVTLNPLHDIINEYNIKMSEHKVYYNDKKYDGIEFEDKIENDDISIKNKQEIEKRKRYKDQEKLYNVILKDDKLTDKIKLAKKANLHFIFDNSFDELEEVSESYVLINESIDVIRYKIEDKIKQLWFLPGIICKKVKKAIKFKKYLIENYWPYEDLDEHHMKLIPFLFPETVGNLAKKTNNWRLEIVKFCIFLIQNDKILNLDDENNIEAFDEKRHELYEIVGESEYSKQNEEWSSPCHELILKDVFCNNCSFIQHMNVITSLVEAEISGKSSFIWLCSNCNAKYDNEFIELKILTLLQETFDAYNSQDLICNNCKSIKSFHRRATCKCGKIFTPRLDINNWIQTLKIMENLANKLNMKLLLDVIESMRTHLI